MTEEQRSMKVVEMMPGHYFETWHTPDCCIWYMGDQPWCNCGGYVNNGPLKEVAHRE